MGRAPPPSRSFHAGPGGHLTAAKEAEWKHPLILDGWLLPSVTLGTQKEEESNTCIGHFFVALSRSERGFLGEVASIGEQIWGDNHAVRKRVMRAMKPGNPDRASHCGKSLSLGIPNE